MKKYLYTVNYIDKNKFLKWFDIEAEHWKDIVSQINCSLKDDVNYILNIRYTGEVSGDNKEN